MRFQLFLLSLLFNSVLSAQVYVVNSTDDVDDGVCDSVHCSLREAINASEVDGIPSNIRFNIPGSGPHVIHPTKNFPNIVNGELTIAGESQPGQKGTLIIDFNYLNFSSPFWKITGSRFVLRGIEFTNFSFKNSFSRVLQFGDDFNNNSEDSRISNCSFINDQILNAANGSWISIYKATNIKITSNNFGTDHLKLFINKLQHCIKIEYYQAIRRVTIDSNVFVNNGIAIDCDAGDLQIHNNIFGALDTFAFTNFLNPKLAIRASVFASADITNNLFAGYPSGVINMHRTYNYLRITNNKFLDNKGLGVIHLENNTTGPVYVTDNYAVLNSNNSSNAPHTFINALYSGAIIERNEVRNYGTFLIAEDPSKTRSVIHSNNRLECLWSNAVVMKGHPSPVVVSVNTGQITGTGIPGDSVAVSSNTRSGCPGAICEGGVEIGRTKVDSSGNWILNAVYPNITSISAFQFGRDSANRRVYSEFSDCYQNCTVPVETYFNPVLCLGRTVLFHSKLYTETSPDDTIYVKGDGVNSCDSIFFVHVMNQYLTEITIPRCHPFTTERDTFRYAVPNCDSVVIITKKEVGLGHFSQAFCDKSSITIWGETFDKNRPSGVIRLANGAQAGCDSVLYVQLNYISIDTSVINFDKGLFALDTVSSYQWLDCSDSSNILQNATNRYYEPSKNGSYAVIIQKNGCIDTSSCYPFIGVSTNESYKQNRINIFPNPVTQLLNIGLEYPTPELEMKIKDYQNRIIIKEKFSYQSNCTLDLENIATGIYFLEVFDGKHYQQIKFLKI
jgi:CSLREA domain-containing protein